MNHLKKFRFLSKILSIHFENCQFESSCKIRSQKLWFLMTSSDTAVNEINLFDWLISQTTQPQYIDLRQMFSKWNKKFFGCHGRHFWPIQDFIELLWLIKSSFFFIKSCVESLRNARVKKEVIKFYCCGFDAVSSGLSHKCFELDRNLKFANFRTLSFQKSQDILHCGKNFSEEQHYACRFKNSRVAHLHRKISPETREEESIETWMHARFFSPMKPCNWSRI